MAVLRMAKHTYPHLTPTSVTRTPRYARSEAHRSTAQTDGSALVLVAGWWALAVAGLEAEAEAAEFLLDGAFDVGAAHGERLADLAGNFHLGAVDMAVGTSEEDCGSEHVLLAMFV